MKNNSALGSIDDPEVVSSLDELFLWSAPFGQLLLETVHYRPGIRFLDVGCGTGFPLIELTQRISGSQGVGIDLWDAGCDRAEFKASKMQVTNVTIVRSPAETMPFDDGDFDLIVSNNGLNNVSDVDRVLAECWRVLNPGGQLIFTVNLPKTMVEFYSIFKKVLKKEHLSDLVPKVDAHIFKKRLPKSTWITKLRDHGFLKIKSITREFDLQFSDGKTLFNHFFMKLAFVKPWEEIVPEEYREQVFTQIIAQLDSMAKRRTGLRLTIPMICFTCSK